MKYKICKLVGWSGSEWYQVKKKGWLFWNWVGKCEGPIELPVFVELKFSTFEDAANWIEQHEKLINNRKPKILEEITYKPASCLWSQRIPQLDLGTELVQLKIAVRSLLDDVNERYPDKNPREWTCKHMQLLDDLIQKYVVQERPTTE